MNYRNARFTASILILVAVLSGCGIQDEMTQNETPNTPINAETSPSPQLVEKQGLFSGIDEYSIDTPETYYNKEHDFSVEYPAVWDVFVEDPTAETDLPNGDPQNGINIYVESNQDNWIYVYGQHSHIALPPPGLGDGFTTTEGVFGYIKEDSYTDEVRMIYLVLGGDRDVGAIIHVNEKVFDENKGQILGILKSIKIHVE